MSIHDFKFSRREAKNGKEYVEVLAAKDFQIGDTLEYSKPICEGSTPRERRRGKQIGTTFHRFHIEGVGKIFEDEIAGGEWKRYYGTYSSEQVVG